MGKKKRKRHLKQIQQEAFFCQITKKICSGRVFLDVEGNPKNQSILRRHKLFMDKKTNKKQGRNEGKQKKEKASRGTNEVADLRW
jgi:hypothetical protein